jgi:hypothetical protein
MLRAPQPRWRMIWKSGYRLSEKIMLKQHPELIALYSGSR